jgi:hypothetical protein
MNPLPGADGATIGSADVFVSVVSDDRSIALVDAGGAGEDADQPVISRDAGFEDTSPPVVIVAPDFPTFWSKLVSIFGERMSECMGDPWASSPEGVFDFAIQYDAWTREIAANRARFDVLGANACLAALQASCRTLTAQPALSNLPGMLNDPAGLCPHVFDGLVEAGHYCGQIGECADSAYECVLNNEVCRATCMARVALGQPCQVQNGSGAGGLCAVGSACVGGRCKALPGMGEPCVSPQGLRGPCAQGLLCATAPGEASLGCRRVAEGSPCESTTDCPEGLACVGVVHDNVGQAKLGSCQPGFPWGTSCSEPVPCAYDLLCILVDPQQHRSECRSPSNDCGGNVYCTNDMTCAYEPDRCVPSLPDGAPCVPDVAPPCGRDRTCSLSHDGSNRCLTNARQLGDACEIGNTCEAGTFCPAGPDARCTKYHLPGEGCSADGDCGPYIAACSNGKCVLCE